jgi:hypothetical protein
MQWNPTLRRGNICTPHSQSTPHFGILPERGTRAPVGCVHAQRAPGPVMATSTGENVHAIVGMNWLLLVGV